MIIKNSIKKSLIKDLIIILLFYFIHLSFIDSINFLLQNRQ